MVFKEIEGKSNVWLPKPGEKLEGTVKQKLAGQFGEQLLLVTDEGEELLTPSHKVLQARLGDISPGDRVRILHTKVELPQVKGHSPTRLYKVWVDDGKVQEEFVG